VSIRASQASLQEFDYRVAAGDVTSLIEQIAEERNMNSAELATAVAADWFKTMARPITTVPTLRAEESLDPFSENYVGHIRAKELGAPCICQGFRINIMCPYHGR